MSLNEDKAYNEGYDHGYKRGRSEDCDCDTSYDNGFKNGQETRQKAIDNLRAQVQEIHDKILELWDLVV